MNIQAVTTQAAVPFPVDVGSGSAWELQGKIKV